ncbi:class I SAM-dependent methyltransferase [Roseibacillus persicicus]|uniref:Methyltransferase domain-containing protein n=1 Tax=Roseibacillus persicicus TaxID=454148 RepID=A0A918TC35_9BACT|nr:class I SAM-dependent methyltransferase [Roseibacillus persicicus]GHC40579.1 hypothetical protein GCM10007100_01350 [Roseibacillus persicicus]
MPLHIDNCVRRTLQDFPWKRRARFFLGRILLSLFPERGRKVAAHPFADNLSPIDKILRNGLYARAFLENDFVTLRHYLANYWKEQAHHFHADWDDRFDRMFVAHDQVIAVPLQAILTKQSPGPHPPELYEIGCGGGQVLDYLSEHLPQISRFYGVDLSSEQIAQNKKSFAENKQLSFVAADAMKWIPENAKPNSVLLSNGGVFEYFLESELHTLFTCLASLNGPTTIALVETFGADHNLATERNSLVYGRELSFSHNYPELLKSAGYTIFHQTERTGFDEDGGGRWIRLVAHKH